jgi:hypothetical protein
MTEFSHELNVTVKPAAKRLALANSYPSAMDIFDIRRRNLMEMLDALARRGITLQKDQAHQLGMAPSFLSQLKAGKKMGEDVARKLEEETRKARGWMDKPQWDDAEETAPQSQSQPLILDVSMIAETVRALRLNAENHGRTFSMESEKDVARFLRYYAYRQVLPDPALLDNVIEIDSRREQEQELVTGAVSDGRAASAPASGADRSGRARKGAPRKG